MATDVIWTFLSMCFCCCQYFSLMPGNNGQSIGTVSAQIRLFRSTRLEAGRGLKGFVWGSVVSGRVGPSGSARNDYNCMLSLFGATYNFMMCMKRFNCKAHEISWTFNIDNPNDRLVRCPPKGKPAQAPTRFLGDSLYQNVTEGIVNSLHPNIQLAAITRLLGYA